MCLIVVTHMGNLPNMSQNETLLTTSEVASALGISVQTVSRWVSIGRLEPVRKLPGLRGAFLFSPADIDALATATCRQVNVPWVGR